MSLGRIALIPVLVVILFSAAPAPLSADDMPWIEHQILQGDTLDSIACKYGIESSRIKWANELQGDEIPFDQDFLLVPRDGGLMLETLAEVRARRRGETTADLYSAARDGKVPVPTPPAANPHSEYPGSEGLPAMARSRAASAAVNTRFTLSWPVEGKVFSPFGPRRGRFHSGVDISAPRGTPIYAAAAGTVVRAAWRSGFGKSILIDHGNGAMTRYSHCDTMVCRAGEKVSAGQKIGTVGRTGRTTGPHLHFEVVIDGKHQDPEKNLPPKGI